MSRKRRAGYQSLWFSFKMLSALLVKLLLQTALSSHPLLSAHQIPGYIIIHIAGKIDISKIRQEDQAQGSSVVEVLFDHQIGIAEHSNTNATREELLLFV